jgi:hypothetical protein
MRRPRLLNLALLACLPAAGMLLTFGTAAGASTAATPSAQAAANARALLHNLSVGQHSANQRVAGHAAKIKGLTQVQSSNWSGYADTSTTFSTVSASWTEPSVTCSGRSTQLAAFWVGIDGYSSDSVEQDGTLAECYEGSLYQYTWWEMYPTNDIQVVGSTLGAGDSISASVVRTGTSYTLKVTDSTHTADSFSTTQTCSSCANSSAEWIAEAPSGSSGVYPLAHFNTWTASKATVNSTGVISSYTDDEITMVDSASRVEAQPGALNSGGNGFSVTWERSS